MHTPSPNRLNPLRLAILLLAITTLTGCRSCPNSAQAVQANLIVMGEIDDCKYSPGIGQQSVYIDIKGTTTNNSTYSWTTTLASVPSGTYSVQVPDRGQFTVTVIASEVAGNSTCLPCISLCGSNTVNPRWQDTENFTGTSAVGNSLNVTVKLPASPSKQDCGC